MYRPANLLTMLIVILASIRFISEINSLTIYLFYRIAHLDFKIMVY